MKLNSLRLLNFRQHADTRVEFETGLTGIIGANGSGKTTILEGIAYALYGVDAARGKKESIRFNRAPARASVRVELDFELGAHRYRVVRGLTSAELYLDNASSPIANTITGVTDMLQRRLGMSRAEFFNTYFTGQKELNVMAAMGPSERAQFLSRVLGYERLRTAQGLVRDRRKLIVAELAGLRQGMPDPDAVVREVADASARLVAARERETAAGARSEAARRELSAVAPRWDEAQKARQGAIQAAAAVNVAEAEDAALARDAERIARDLAELAAAQQELARLTEQLAPLASLGAELQHLDALAREEGRRQVLQQSERSLQEELQRLRERREKVAAAPALEQETTVALAAARESVEVAAHDLEERRTLWVRDRQEAETKLQALREQYAEAKDLRDRVLAAGPAGTCPTCARSLDGTYQSVLDMFTEQVETLGVDGTYFKRRFEQLQKTPDDVIAAEARRKQLADAANALERRLAKVQAAMQEMATLDRDVQAKEQRLLAAARDLAAIPSGYDQQRHDTVRAEVGRLAPISARAARLGAQSEREPQLRRDGARVAELRQDLAERLVELRARRDAVGFSEPDFAALRSAYEAALADARSAEIAAATAAGDAAAAHTAIAAAERRRDELAKTQAAVATLQTERRLHEELDRAYTDLRTDLNFQLRPELSELASAFLTELTDARYSELELDDQYNVIVLEDGVPKPVISGGEEDLANLVLRLAISQMIAERAGQSFSLLVLDEVFGSLDESRRGNVVDLLRRLQDRFEQVILITHIESVREGLDRVISVRYDEERGSSSVEVSDGGAAGETFGAGGVGAPSYGPTDELDVDLETGDEIARPGERLMAATRGWRGGTALHGPSPIRREDIASLNEVFSDAFSDRYRKDGMVGVRVPHLNPSIWRYAIEDAGSGAMLWRDERGQIAAFNIAHLSGTEGWMGPLAVRPDAQGGGAGKEVVRAGMSWLAERGAVTVGLETMPRTMDNIGFYSSLGFVPGRMTFTLTLDARPAERPAPLLSRLAAAERDAALEECRALVASLTPGYDFTREITLTEELALGDTLLLRERGALVGFALCHSAPLVEGRVREELRVLKLAVARPDLLDAMAGALADHARRAGTRRAALRVQGVYEWAYRRLIGLGARVRWTDLRMTLADHPEREVVGGMVLSNWEI